MRDTIKGTVIKGHGVGKTMGFPTVNVSYSGDLSGVFAGYFSVVGENKEFRAAINIGGRPTFNDDEVVLEAHLIDLESFSVSLGENVEIRLVEELRSVEKFSDKKSLVGQIAKDVEKVRELL